MVSLTLSTPSSRTATGNGATFFYALVPDALARTRMLRTGERFQQTHRLIGTPVEDAALHLTLCPAGKPESVFQSLEGSLIAAGDAVAARRFDVSLDAAMRLSLRDDHFPFVLCCDAASSVTVLGLRRLIAAEQARLGLQVTGISSFMPHITLLRGSSIDAIEQPISPFGWTAATFVLLRSFFGQSRYEVVRSWPLATNF